MLPEESEQSLSQSGCLWGPEQLMGDGVESGKELSGVLGGWE